MRLAKGLIYVNNPITTLKRGRLSTSKGQSEEPECSRKKAKSEVRLAPEIQLDLTDHMPEYNESEETARCKAPFYKGKLTFSAQTVTHIFALSKIEIVSNIVIENNRNVIFIYYFHFNFVLLFNK